MSERLQKLLATLGIASRRQIEAMIEQGRISVNGKVARLGDRASHDDTIRIDGRPVRLHHRPRAKQRVLAYNKPEGEVCTRDDPEGRPTIFERLPRLRSGRWIAVGRLDINTSGLILLTTDGELANRLMHPSSEIEREYAVRIMGEASPETIERLLAGVELEDGPARFGAVRDAGGQGLNHWYHVTLAEGRKREVRRLWESQGHTVSRLIRLRYGPVQLHRGLRPGQWEELDRRALAELYGAVGIDFEQEEREARGGREPARRAGGAKRKRPHRHAPRARRPRR